MLVGVHCWRFVSSARYPGSHIARDTYEGCIFDRGTSEEFLAFWVFFFAVGNMLNYGLSGYPAFGDARVPYCSLVASR